jgi:hypothetical protein
VNAVDPSGKQAQCCVEDCTSRFVNENLPTDQYISCLRGCYAPFSRDQVSCQCDTVESCYDCCHGVGHYGYDECVRKCFEHVLLQTERRGNSHNDTPTIYLDEHRLMCNSVCYGYGSSCLQDCYSLFNQSISNVGGCQVAIAATSVFSSGYHSFVIYTDEQGNVRQYHGEPSGNVFAYIFTNVEGPIVVEFRDNQWIPPSGNETYRVLAAGPDICGINECLNRVSNLINDNSIDYFVTGPNCNSVTRTLLQSCNLPVVEPRGGGQYYPGWEWFLDVND